MVKQYRSLLCCATGILLDYNDPQCALDFIDVSELKIPIPH